MSLLVLWLPAAIAFLIMLMALALKKATEIAIEKEYSVWAPRVARCLARIAGLICWPHRDDWWADLIYQQDVAGETGLTEGLSCMVASPFVMCRETASFVFSGIRKLIAILVESVRLARKVIAVSQRGPVHLLETWASARLRLERNLKSVSELTVDWYLCNCKVSPILLSTVASWLALLAALFVAIGHTAIGAAFLTTSCLAELLDGMEAKRRVVPLRAVLLDYIADRVGDLALFGALVIWSINLAPPIAIASALAGVSALLGSYVRAETHALGIAQRDALVGRAERLVALTVTLWLGALFGVGAMTVGVSVVLGVTLLSLTERLYRAFTARLTADAAAEMSWDSWDKDAFLPKRTVVNDRRADRLRQQKHSDESVD